MKKRFIGIGIGIILALLVLATWSPTVGADKYQNFGGLDPQETPVVNNAWTFSCGVSQTYGVYLRDVSWNSVGSGWCLYAGMINVPWVNVFRTDGDCVTYDVPGGSSAGEMELENREVEEFGENNLRVQFDFSFPDFYSPGSQFKHKLSIKFELIDRPWTLPNGGIWCHITHSRGMPFELYTIEGPFRIDFDIVGEQNDRQWVWTGVWTQINPETSFQTNKPHSNQPWPNFGRGIKVKQDDICEEVYAGIEPETDSDTAYCLRYWPNEFKGHPSNYVTGEALVGFDDLFWILNTSPTTFWYSAQTSRTNIFLW